MKARVVTVLAILGSSAQAGTPPSVKTLVDSLGYVWSFKNNAWVWSNSGSYSCKTKVADIVEAGVADTLSVEVPYDTPDFKKGMHTVKELKALCQHAEDSDLIRSFVGWAEMASRPEEQDGLMASKCVDAYNVVLARHKPTVLLPYEGFSLTDPATGDPFAGTIEAAKTKFCAAKFDKANAERAAIEGPYRKVLKADKLETAIEKDFSFILVGGKTTDDPNALAKASVWFKEYKYPDRSCNQGVNVVHQLVRYRFDAKHVLVDKKVTDRCGPSPASAFR